jgi:CRISPR-associated endonuclease Cas3-HD
MKLPSSVYNGSGLRPLLSAPNETLEKHIKCVARELAERLLEKRARAIARFLQSYSIEVELRDAKNALLYSAIFHDLGKAYDRFQERIIEAVNKGSSDFSVPRHELFSAFATSQILTEKAFINSFEFLRDCVLLSIVWSHLSSRGAILQEIRETTARYVPDKLVSLDATRKQELTSMLNSILTEYECKAGVDLSRLPVEISIDEVKEMLNALNASLEKGPYENKNLLYHAVLPILSSLQLVDSLVSHKNRGGKQPIYVIDLPDPSTVGRVRKALWPIGR